MVFPIVMAIAGAASGVLGYAWDSRQRYEALDRQKTALKEAKKQALKTLDEEFKISKEVAYKNADTQDRTTTTSESVTSKDINNQISSLSLSELAQSYGYNSQLMSNDADKGNALSNMAMSGTRNSSVSTAIDLQSSVNRSQLEEEKQIQTKQNDLTLSGIMNQLVSNTAGIQSNRNSANDLRDSFLENTGSQWKTYNLNKENTEFNYEQEIKAIQDQMDEQADPWNNFIGGFTAAFNGGKNGLQTGYQIGSYLQNNKNPNYNTSTSNSNLSYSWGGYNYSSSRNVYSNINSGSDYYKYGSHW